MLYLYCALLDCCIFVKESSSATSERKGGILHINVYTVSQSRCSLYNNIQFLLLDSMYVYFFSTYGDTLCRVIPGNNSAWWVFFLRLVKKPSTVIKTTGDTFAY